MGGLRCLALALLAPLLGVSAAWSATPAQAAVPSARGAHAVTSKIAQDVTRARTTNVSSRDDASRTGGHRLQVPGHVRLLAARLYWGARPPSYPSTTSIRRDLRKTADYFDRVSRGRQHVRTTLTRWVHVDVSGDVMCNTQGRSVRAASAALRRAGYHPARFNRLMILTEQCNAAASAAQLPGRVSWIRYRNPGMPTLVHELGHNLGLEHAFGVVCRQGGRRVSLGGACLPVAYGDSWDAMGHSKGFFSAAALVRLGWAGTIERVRESGTYQVADVAHSGRANQALRIRSGTTTYWVEYQPEHSPEIGRTIPGVMIRRQVAGGPVELIDASPGNPTGIDYPDADLTNAALPVGSSLTTPDHVRFTTVAQGRRATVQVTFDATAAVPDAPVVETAVPVGTGYRVHWKAPADHGQIVLGYRVTSMPGGTTTYVRSPAGYRTSVIVKTDATEPPTFTVQALNQLGWSAASTPLTVGDPGTPGDPGIPGDPGDPGDPGTPGDPGDGAGAQVSITSPAPGAKLRRSFEIDVTATADPVTSAAPVSAWAEVGSVACSTQEGAGPYLLQCADTGRVLHGWQVLTVHVRDQDGATTDVTVPVLVRGR